MSHRRRGSRGGLLAVVGLATVIALGVWAGATLAGPGGTPGAVTGLTSTTHPNEATWYASNAPAFSWNPTQATDAAIVGYSFAFDQSATTVPDTTSDRVSLSYLPRVSYAAGTRPAEVRVGDLNGDGKQDVVAENYGSNTVSVLVGKGDGTFNAKVDYATGAGPWSLQLGDVNRDGKLDIVTGNLSADSVSVLLGRGDGTFNAKRDYATGSQPECMRIGDLNKDGYLDAVTTNAGANTLSVLLNKGDGTFASKNDYATSTHPTSIDIGDLNGDGAPDLVAANTGTSTVSVLTGKGDGTFNAKNDYVTGSQPYTVMAADVNRDGKLDVETCNYGAGTASILLGKGDGTLNAKTDYAVGAGPYAIDVRDLNQDGAPDLVTTNHDASTVSVLLGNGDGTFTAKTDWATGTGPFWVALGDFNGDGYGDLVVSDYSAGTASVFLGTAYLSVGFSGKADGVWYFHVRALDSSGAGGPTSTRAVRIDPTAPTSSQSGADGAWHNTAVTVTLAATDVSSGVAKTEYRLDGGDWTEGTSLTVAAPAGGGNDGVHTIAYRSTDVAGNVEVANTATVGISTTAPTTTVAGVDEAWHDDPVTLTFSGSGNGGLTTQYRVDGGDWTTGTSVTVPAPADGANDGEHTVEYRSTDAAGNVENAKSCTVKIVTSAPTTSVSGVPEGWQTGDVTLSFSASSTGAPVTEHSVDDGGWQTGTSVVIQAPADGSNDGVHTVEYRSVNGAGLVEATQSVSVQIDAGAPTTSVSGGDDSWHAGDVVLTFSGADAGSGVDSTEYRVDGGEWTTGTSLTVPAPADGSNDGVHAVEYRSIDALGHVEVARTADVKIDATAPTTTQTGADLAWHDTDVTVSFSGSDAGSGVDSTEYRLDGGDWVTGTSVTVPAPADGSNDGVHTIEYRSTDVAGNVEETRGCTVLIDTDQPVTSDNAGSAWHALPFTLVLTASDHSLAQTTTEYRLGENGLWQTGVEIPFLTSWKRGGGSGAYTVYYHSIDGAGHVEAERSCVVLIDTSRPVTSDDAPRGPQATDVTVHLTGRDQFSGVGETWYQIDGGTWQMGASLVVPAPGDHSNDGLHTIKYYSIDNAGNLEVGYRICTVRIATQ